MKSFNGALRAECLAQEMFSTLTGARTWYKPKTHLGRGKQCLTFYRVSVPLWAFS